MTCIFSTTQIKTQTCSIEPYGLLNITIPPFRRAQEEILNREWFLATSLNNQRRGEISKDTHWIIIPSVCLVHHGSPAASQEALLDTSANYSPGTQCSLAAIEDMSRWGREKMTEDTETANWRERGKTQEWWSDWNASQTSSLSHCLTVMRAPTEGVHKLANSHTHACAHTAGCFCPPP